MTVAIDVGLGKTRVALEKKRSCRWCDRFSVQRHYFTNESAPKAEAQGNSCHNRS
jgi:hypothetical protein